METILRDHQLEEQTENQLGGRGHIGVFRLGLGV